MVKATKTWSRDHALEAHEIDAFFRELKKISLREYIIAKYVYIFKQNMSNVLACGYETSPDELNTGQKIVEIKHPWDYEGTDYTSILADRQLYLLSSQQYRPSDYGLSPLFVNEKGSCVHTTRVYNAFVKASNKAGIQKVTAVNILATSHVLGGKS